MNRALRAEHVLDIGAFSPTAHPFRRHPSDGTLPRSRLACSRIYVRFLRCDDVAAWTA